MKSVLLVLLATAACADIASESLVPCDGSPEVFQIDGFTISPNASGARQFALDLDGDHTRDNQLGQVTGTLLGLFANLDFESVADDHLTTDTDWRLSVWQCPSDTRLFALSNGVRSGIADFRGTVEGGRIAGHGTGAEVPLGALMVGAEPGWVVGDVDAIELADPIGADELTATIAVAYPGEQAQAVIVHAMTPFLADNATGSVRDELDGNGDGRLTEQEIATAPVVLSLLAPDIDVGDHRSLSHGFAVHATRIR